MTTGTVATIRPKASRASGVGLIRYAKKACDSAGDVIAKVQNDSAKCADVDGDIYDQTLILHAGEIRQQNEVSRGRNGEKFSDPLNDGDKN